MWLWASLSAVKELKMQLMFQESSEKDEIMGQQQGKSFELRSHWAPLESMTVMFIHEVSKTTTLPDWCCHQLQFPPWERTESCWLTYVKTTKWQTQRQRPGGNEVPGFLGCPAPGRYILLSPPGWLRGYAADCPEPSHSGLRATSVQLTWKHFTCAIHPIHLLKVLLSLLLQAYNTR